MRKYNAMMLVGPPGTGKTTLLLQLYEEEVARRKAAQDARPFPKPLVKTLDDSWTSLDLIGGRSIVRRSIRFKPGALLEAIRDGQWLILDEINRADLDRIFGGLLTWLSGQETSVGRESDEPNAREILLDWAKDGEAGGKVEDAERNVVRYLADPGFRLLGTYNAQDAHRVFRFGDALGRRFVRVPIAEPDVETFREVLAEDAKELSEDERASIVKLYQAHRSAGGRLVLGPALFLQMARYMLPEGGEPPRREWLQEAYLINVGPFLARESDGQAALEAHVLRATGSNDDDGNSGGVFDKDEWQWIKDHLRHLV